MNSLDISLSTDFLNEGQMYTFKIHKSILLSHTHSVRIHFFGVAGFIQKDEFINRARTNVGQAKCVGGCI